MNTHDPRSTFLVPLPSVRRAARADALEVEGRFVGSRSGDVWLVRAVGEIDVDTSKKLEKTIAGMLDAEALSIVLNVEDVSYIDSIGFGLLVKTKKRLAAKGLLLCLVDPSAHVRRVLRSAGLDMVIECFASEERALEAVNQLVPANGQQSY